MTQEWLLVETLGDQPVVVAQGRQMKNFVPLAVFLRRNPSLAAIQTAIAETVGTGNSLASITPKNKRVIRTEPVQMSDGRIHGELALTGELTKLDAASARHIAAALLAAADRVEES